MTPSWHKYLLHIGCLLCCLVFQGTRFLVAAQTFLRDSLVPLQVIAESESVLRSSVPVYQVDKQQLEQRGQNDLARILNEFPGVSIRDYGGVGGIKSIQVRNMSSAHTTVVYDGLDLGNMQNSQVDLSRIALEEVDKLRVEPSGRAGIFCSATQQLSASLLSLNSQKPLFDSRPWHLSAQLSAGSFGTWNPHLRYEQKISEAVSMRLHGSFLSSCGDYPFVVENGSATERRRRVGSSVMQGNFAGDIYASLGGRGGNLHSKLTYAEGDRGIPGPVILYVEDATEQLWTRDVAARLQWENYYKGCWHLQVALNYAQSQTRYQDSDPVYSEPQEDFYRHQKMTIEAIAAYSLSSAWHFSYAQDIHLAHLYSDMPQAVWPRRIHSVSALSAQYQGDKWQAKCVLGLHYVSEALQAPPSTTESLQAAADRVHFSPALSLSYQLSPTCLLRASLKDTYRMPNFNDLYYARVGNRSLRPERALQSNFGVLWQSPWGLNLSADAYAHFIRDKIVAIPTLFIWKMYNLDRAWTTGIDLSAAYTHRFLPSLAISAQAKYSYQYSVDITDPRGKSYGLPLPYTAPHSGSAVLSVLTTWFNFSYSLDGMSARYATAQPLPSSKLSPYLLHSLSINRKFALAKTELYINASVHNLANCSYELVKNYPMPGINYKLTLRISL